MRHCNPTNGRDCVKNSGHHRLQPCGGSIST